MRVDQEQECLIANRLRFEVHKIHRIAAQKHSEATHKWRSPFFFAHFVPAGIEPHHIFNFRAPKSPSLEKFWTPKYRMILAQLDQPAREFQQLVLVFVTFPMEPAG